MVFIVCSLSVILTAQSTIKTAVKNGVKNIQTAGYNGTHTYMGLLIFTGDFNAGMYNVHLAAYSQELYSYA